jgi:hypothetical protein
MAMTRPVTVNDILDGQVVLDLECLDRIYLNVYVPNLQVAGQVVTFLTRHLGNPIPSPAIFDEIGTAFRKSVARFAQDNHIPVVRFGKTDRKIEIMQPHLDRQARTGRPGVAAIGVAQEFAPVCTGTQRPAPNGIPWFSFTKRDRRVSCYYFYLWDAEFGPAFIKICAYFPYPAKIWINGHEWAKRQALMAGIRFTQLIRKLEVSGQATAPGVAQRSRVQPNGAGWSGGGFEGDSIAEGVELADVVTDLAFAVGVAGVEVRAQVVEAGVRVGQQVPDDDQDGAAEGDDGFLRAAAAGDPPVALAGESVGPAGSDGGLIQNPGQVGVAVTGAAGAFLLPGGFGDSGCELRPGAQVPRGGDPAHVGAGRATRCRTLRVSAWMEVRRCRSCSSGRVLVARPLP